MACQDDPELRAAVLGADFTVPDGQPLVWALQRARPRAARPRLRPRADGPRVRARRPRPGSASTSTAAATRARSPQLARDAAPAPSRACRSSAATRRRSATLDRGRGGARSPRDINALAAPTSSGSGSACPSRRSGWRACATASTRPCWSASAPRSTSTPASCRRRPRWMQRLGLEWVFRLAQEPRRLWRRYLRYNPRFVAGFARQYAARTGCASRAASLSAPMSYDVSVIGLGRVGLPLALVLRGRRARACSASTRTPSGSTRCASGRMPFKEPGTDELLAARRRSTLVRSAPPTPRRPTRSCSRSARRRFSHIEIDMGDIRSVLDDLLPRAARGPAARAALDRRARARPSSSPATWRSTAASGSARTCSSRTCRSGSPPTASWRRSATLPCIVGGVGEASGERAARLFERARRADRADHAGPGRAGEDLDQHPALRDVRAARTC